MSVFGHGKDCDCMIGATNDFKKAGRAIAQNQGMELKDGIEICLL